MLLRCVPLVMMVAVAAATAGTPSVDVTGEYTSNYDDVRLVQHGNYVTGTYVCCGGGTIEGRIYESHVIRYHWKQSGSEGEGVWEIKDSEHLEGTWGTGQSDSDGGDWNLERKHALVN
jgi:hypothetical protein